VPIKILFVLFPKKYQNSLQVKVGLFCSAHLSGDFTPPQSAFGETRNPPDAFASQNFTVFVSIAKNKSKDRAAGRSAAAAVKNL